MYSLLVLALCVRVGSHIAPFAPAPQEEEEQGFCLLQRHATITPVLREVSARTRVGEAAELYQNPTVDLRPSQGGAPDVVQFGMIIKAFGGVDLKASTWSVDLVLTARWTDPRTSVLVPAGSTSITLPTATALTQMWLPDMVVTNRAKQGVDVLSSAVNVGSTGVVTKTERLLATLRASLDLRAFPFDRQELTVILSSSSLMLNELKLSPIDVIDGVNVSSVSPEIFNAKDIVLQTFNLTEFEETDGSLQKSRGMIKLNVQREAMPLVQSLIVPQLLLVLVSWSVFWFPLQPAYVMPRVATGALALVALMAFSARMASAMPPDCALTWVDVFCGACQYLMIWAMLFNLFINIIQEMHLTSASVTNSELQCLFGVLLVFVIITLICGIGCKTNSILSLITKLEVFGTTIPYIVYCIFRARWEVEKEATPRR